MSEEFNDYQYNDYNGSQDNDRKPGGKKGLKITAIVLAAVIVFGGLIFGAYTLVRHSAERLGLAKHTEVTEALAEGTEDESALAAATEGSDVLRIITADDDTTAAASADTASTLVKNNISETETDAKTVVLDVSEVVENVMPSVVAITDNLEVTSGNNYNPYNYFFGGSRSGRSEIQESVSSGSGVIIAENDDTLLIVTNNHVVDNEGNYSYYSVSSTGLTVQFCDGTTASASVKGTDSEEDLAVISVNLSELSEETKDTIRVAVCGNSDELKVGSGVIAIGNAMGYGQSVTTGIISAKDRAVTIDGITRYLLQTDAAINPGNSGGGLFNAKGELIGINSAKSVDTSVEGMGFAIPITSAADIIEDLMNYEPIAEEDQGYLGINGETVPDTYVSKYGYPKGVSVTRIAEDSPAEKAGLQIYDIITAVDGREVETMNALKSKVNSYAAGTTITVSISRPEGRSFKEMEVEVTLARYEDISEGLIQEAPSEEEPSGETPDNDRPNMDEYFDDDDDINSFFDWLFDQFK